jgi:non-ribosomal peptide synthetase component F
LSYLDAIIEQQIPMTAANMFWLDTLHDCNLDRSLPLPYDRYRLSNEHRTGRVTSISFDFGQDLSSRFLACASSNNIQPQHLALACYYVVLFKLTNGERDLCIGMNVDNRYRDELKSIIGIFENIIPLRCQLDPYWSFHQLIEHIKEMVIGSLKYSYFPLQRILAQHPDVSKAAFLDTSFVFHSTENQNTENEVIIGNSQLRSMPISIKVSKNEIMSKFDFALTIQHDMSTNQLSCTIDASFDLFDTTTVHKIAQRFHSMLEHLFKRTNLQMNKPMYELSLILPDERVLMQSMNNTQVLFPFVSCIHHEFVAQAMKHPQQIAVELDDQSLTYSELLYYVQVLSLHLLSEQRILPSDVICQCVERSLSMVSGLNKRLLKIIKSNC